MWFRSIPFPPSVNQLYSGKLRRFKSKIYKQFDKDVKAWAAPQKIKPIKEQKLSLYGYFYAPKELWFTKDGRARSIDLSNRIKALEDSLFEYLGIDDKWIFELHLFKCIGEKKVDVYLSSFLIDQIKTPIESLQK